MKPIQKLKNRIILVIVAAFIATNICPAYGQIKGYSTDYRLSKKTREFLTALNTSGVPPLETLSPEKARIVLANSQKSVKVDLSGIVVTKKRIESDGFFIDINIVKPAISKGILPVFMFFHGGGWVLGDFPIHERMVRDLVVQSGCAAVFVNYTLSPEAKFPQALNECYAATKWVASHGKEIGIDGKRLAVVGNSAGGNLSTTVAMMAKAKKGPVIKLQILMWPAINTDYTTESYNEFGKDRFLTSSLMQWMYDLYSTNPEQRKEIYYSPVKATTEQLKGMPPALIQVAENDILRDEGETYGRELDEAGVPETTIRYNGMIHDFGMLNALAGLPQTKALFVQAGAELRKYLKP